MIRRSTILHSALFVVAGCASNPSAVMHVTPASGQTPSVNVFVCAAGATTADSSCAGPSTVLDGSTTQTHTAAIFDHKSGDTVAVLFAVQSSGGSYCSEIGALDLSHGNLDFDVTVDKCAISFSRISLPAPTDCAPRSCQ